MDYLSLLFLSLFFSLVCGLELRYADDINQTYKRFINSPQIYGRLVDAVPDSSLLIAPDSMHGCDMSSISNLLGWILLVDDTGCSFHQKIEQAYDMGAEGLIIQSSNQVSAGMDYAWAGQGMSVPISVVEISRDDGDYIRQMYNLYPLHTSFDGSDTNPWKNLFDSIYFIVLFQGVLSVYFAAIIGFTIYRYIKTTRHGVNNGKTLITCIFFSLSADIHYITILGSVFSLMYVMIDPFHSRGIFSKMSETVLLTFGFPLPFIGAFLLSYSMYHLSGAVNTMNAKDHINTHITKIVLLFLSVSAAVGIFNLLSSILYGGYVGNFSYVEIIGIFYLVLSALVIAFFLYVTVRFHRLSESVSATVNKLERLSRRFIRMSIFMSVIYLLWTLLIAARFMQHSYDYPVSKVTIYFFCFLITGILNVANILFVPMEQVESGHHIHEESMNSVYGMARRNPISIPHVTEKSSSETEVEVRVMETPMSAIYPMSKASSMTAGGPMDDSRDVFSDRRPIEDTHSIYEGTSFEE